MRVTVNMKSSGKKSSIVKKEYELSSVPSNLGGLLDTVVGMQAEEFTARLCKSDNSPSLTREELERAAATGKVAFGLLSEGKIPDLPEARKNVREALEEGRIAVFIDGRQYERLDEEVALAPGSEITFIKLVLLAGRIW